MKSEVFACVNTSSIIRHVRSRLFSCEGKESIVIVPRLFSCEGEGGSVTAPDII